MDEIRWYKGKYKVKILKRSKVKGKHRPRNMLVEALEDIPLTYPSWIPKGSEFTTVPRLLWRHPRE